MCVIAVCRKRRLTVQEVRRMDAANPHGVGIAWIARKGRTVEFVKGLTAEDAVALLPQLPLPHVVHFRFASVGAIGPALCHPFAIEPAPGTAVEGAAPAVLFHNGTWVDWRLGVGILRELGAWPDGARRRDWSDSRVMAALMAAYSPRAVSEVVGERQRLVVVHGSGRIETFGAFAPLRGGIEVSNLWWRDLPRPASPAPAPKKPRQLALADTTVDACRPWVEAPAARPNTYARPSVPRPLWPDYRR